MENSGYLFAGYAIVWLVLFVYVLILINRQNKLQKEIRSLKNSLDRKTNDK